MSEVHVFDHPLISDKLTRMRRVDTSSQDFRLLLKEISLLMGYEVTRDFATKEVTVETPICEGQFPELKDRLVTIVPILRAGVGMVDGLLELMPYARVGKSLLNNLVQIAAGTLNKFLSSSMLKT